MDNLPVGLYTIEYKDISGWTPPDYRSIGISKHITSNVQDTWFMIVFASGKDRRDPASELHTSFSLSKDGEYLALIAPDGNTIVHEYLPEYPEQLSNISYGLSQYSEVVVERYYIPRDEVKYDSVASWPLSANGSGDSLHRIDDYQYANDYLNWTASGPGPNN